MIIGNALPDVGMCAAHTHIYIYCIIYIYIEIVCVLSFILDSRF